MKLVAEYRLRNDPAEANRIEGWMNTFADAAQLSPEARNAFDHALVEWITNVISYTHEDGREHWILVRFLASPDQAKIVVEDEGREFNPLKLPPVDTSAPLEQRPIGGLGVHMIRRLMDSVEYRRESRRNILTMTRRVR